MATSGRWLGDWPGDWFGAQGEADPNALRASLSGAGALSATADGVSASAVAGGSGRAKRRRDVLKDIKRLNELIIRREAGAPIITIQPYDETDDEEALMLLL